MGQEPKNANQTPELSVGDQIKVRREKLAQLQAEGHDPFQLTKFVCTSNAEEIKAHFDEMEGKPVSIAGRMMSKRGMGFDKIAEHIYNYPEVKSVYLISGGFDLMVTLEGKTLREVSQFVTDKLSTLDQVLSTKTNFILKKYKDHGTIMAAPVKSDERGIMS